MRERILLFKPKIPVALYGMYQIDRIMEVANRYEIRITRKIGLIVKTYDENGGKTL